MRLIIAGGRDLHPSFGFIDSAIKMLQPYVKYGPISEVVCGGAPGVDTEGAHWANHVGVPVKYFRADWENIDVPGAVIKTRRDGTKYNAVAGLWRNRDMAVYGEVLLLIWNGSSSGSGDMFMQMKKVNKPIYEVTLSGPL